MKEAYYRPDTIDELSNRWLETYSSVRHADSQPFLIADAALLILDMQDYFLVSSSHAYIPSGPALIPRLNRVIAEFRSAGRPVIATRHINRVENAARMGSWWSEIITEEHPLSGLQRDLTIEQDEIISKPQYNAFYGSDLEARLVDLGISQLVIGGVMTHLCCETTAREAFIRGYEVFFLIDGTATYTSDFHTASLLNLAHGFAVLTTTTHLFGED